MHHNHRSFTAWGTRTAWLGAFLLATVLFSVGLTCAVPLVAFAAICAVRQPRGQALLFTAVLWLATELVGFTLLRFPITGVAFGWGALVGAALLAATWAAGTLARRMPRVAGMPVAFAAAFGVYEGVLWAVSRALGAAKGAFTADILFQVFVLNVVTFIALLVVGALTTRAAGGGAPAQAAQRAA